MKGMLRVAGMASLLGVVAGAALWARQENVPGFPTIARMQVINRGAGEAVPVTVHASGDVIPVAIAGGPATVAFAPTAVVSTRTARQLWEYRQVRMSVDQDPTRALNASGAEGWEAVGLSTSAGDQVWTLKRPR